MHFKISVYTEKWSMVLFLILFVVLMVVPVSALTHNWEVYATSGINGNSGTLTLDAYNYSSVVSISSWSTVGKGGTKNDPKYNNFGTFRFRNSSNYVLGDGSFNQHWVDTANEQNPSFKNVVSTLTFTHWYNNITDSRDYFDFYNDTFWVYDHMGRNVGGLDSKFTLQIADHWDEVYTIIYSEGLEDPPTCDFGISNSSHIIPFTEIIGDMSEFWTYGVYQIAYLNGTIIEQWDTDTPGEIYYKTISVSGYLDISLYGLNEAGTCQKNYTVYAIPSSPEVTPTITPYVTSPINANVSIPGLPGWLNSDQWGADICNNASYYCPLVNLTDGIEETANGIYMVFYNAITLPMVYATEALAIATDSAQTIALIYISAMDLILYSIYVIFDKIGVDIQNIAIFVLSLDLGWVILEEFFYYQSHRKTGGK